MNERALNDFRGHRLVLGCLAEERQAAGGIGCVAAGVRLKGGFLDVSQT